MSDRLMGKSAYEVLGVSAQAPDADLKKAYRRRMRQSHPDLGGDPEEFAAVQEAWAQVGSPAERAAYDRRRRSPAPAQPDPRVWATGASARSGAARPSASGRARSSGHPGGWSRQRYLTLIREWAGRGVDLPDPYEPALVARAPREIRHLLADAIAEEATAKALTALGSAYTAWHDVATTRGARRGGPGAGASKVDHIVLGPTGLFAIQSEDWDAPVAVGGRDLHSRGLGAKERPFKELAGRVKAARSWGVTFTALVIVLPDEHLEDDVAAVGRTRRTARLVVRRSAIAPMLRSGPPGIPGLAADVLFDRRTHLQRTITFV